MVGETIEAICKSTFWDNDLWQQGNLEFTECFHKSILIWIPCLFLVMFFPAEIYNLWKLPRCRQSYSKICLVKMIISVLLLCLMLVEFLLIMYLSSDVAWVDIYSGLARCICMGLACICIKEEKARGITSTFILSIFWLLFTLCGSLTFRSIVLGKLKLPIISSAGFIFYYPLFIVQLILSLYSEFSGLVKKNSSNENEKIPYPEWQASLLSRMFFVWFNPLINLGYQRPLTIQDLWALDDDFKAATIHQQFSSNWENEKRSRPENPSLISNIIKTYGMDLAVSAVLKLLCDVLIFANPILLKWIIKFVSTSEPIWKGYFYALSLFLCGIIHSIIINQHHYKIQKCGVKIRSAITLLIYEKALKITYASRYNSTLGEIVNLMAVDAQLVVDLIIELCFYWTAPLQLTIALYMIWQMMGSAMWAGLIIMLIMVPTNAYIANYAKTLQHEMMKVRDQRIRTTNEVLSGIKVLKLYAWELSFYDFICSFRKKELVMMANIAYVKATTTFFFQITPILITIGILTTYVILDPTNVLDATKAFVTLTLIQVLKTPLNHFPVLLALYIQAIISLHRLNKFMKNEEVSPDVVTHFPSEEHAIVLKNSSFAWNRDDSPAIYNINLAIKNQSLVVVVGPVGSGKSSLLMALLGELEKTGGTINTYGSIAYVPQQAWIQNDTLRNNILFGKPMKRKLYNTILEVCALNQDLELLSGKDLTEIGEKGTNLSGGQKQRVSLARAVYNDADIYLLDDPLSAVDSHVGKHILEHVIGPNGLLKNKTRVLVTHGISCLPFADIIVVLKEGKISQIGTYQELLDEGGDFSTFLVTYIKEKPVLDPLEAEELQMVQEHLLETISNEDLKRYYTSLFNMKLSDNPAVTQSKAKSNPDSRRSSHDSYKSRHSSVSPFSTQSDILHTATRKESVLRRRTTAATSASQVTTAAEIDDKQSIKSEENLNLVDRNPSLNYPLIHRARALTNANISASVDSLYARRSHTNIIGHSTSVITREASHTTLLPDHEALETESQLELRSKLITQEVPEEGKVSRSVYLYYIRSLGYFLCFVVMSCLFLSEICNIGGNIWLSKWSSDIPGKNGTINKHHRNYRLFVYTALGIGQSILMLIGTLVLVKAVLQASRILHDNMLYCVLRSPIQFFDQTPVGRLLNRFSKDMEGADESVPKPLRPLLTHILHVFATIYIITANTPIFLAVIPFIIYMYNYVQRMYLFTSRHLKRLEAISRSPIYAHFSETVTGLATIRAYKKENDFLIAAENSIDLNQILLYPRLVSKRWLTVRLDFIGSLVILATGCFAIYSRHSISPSVVGLMISYAVQVTHLLGVLVRMSSDLETSIVAVERIKEYSSLPSELPWHIPEKEPPSKWPEEGRIQFVNYCIRYRENLEYALKFIECTILGGEKIGLVGRTGAGKSSFTLALFRVLEATEGTIYIDDINISELGLHDLRSRLTIIPQEPVLFSGSLRMNIDPLHSHSEQDIWKVLSDAALLDFVSALPNGLYHEISEAGENLSLGQKQLVCLARALLRNTKILVLDEATAAIDLETDDLIQATIRKEFADCTILTIAHRINTVLDSTRIMVLVDGQLEEFDKPSSLLENTTSIFYNMVKDAGLVD